MSSLNDRKEENSPSKKTPLIINLFNTKYSVVHNAANELSFAISESNDSMSSFLDWDFKWTDTSQGPQLIKRMSKHQRINYFIGISSIARKNLLMVNLYTMRKYFPDDYDFFPQTFLFPADSKKILNYQRQKIKNKKQLTFIVKPEASCQGRGIYLCQHFSELNTESKSIVQEYISNPMLYDGLKFDFRVYVLLKNIHPLEIYLYKEGLVRFATQKYEEPSKNNLDDLCLHLTNYAINKHSPKYEFNQTLSNLNFGHKKSLAEFFKSLNSLGYNSYRIWRQIKECVNKTIISVQPHLHSEYRKAQPRNQSESLCYQVLGFDFMLNDEKKVYLLEVNQSPSFSTETPLDFLVKNFLIKDTLKIVLHDKERRKANLQLRSKRMRTEANDLDYEPKSIRRKETVEEEIPSSVLGNYERIFPAFDVRTQKSYEQMLQTIKADYHKTTIDDTSFDAGNDSLGEIHVRSPQLKINSRKERSFKSIYLMKRETDVKQRAKKLTLLNGLESPTKMEAYEQRRRMLSMRKEYLLSKSLEKSITQTSYVLESLSTIKVKNIRDKQKTKSIYETLPAVKEKEDNQKKGIRNKPKNLSDLNVENQSDSLGYLSTNFITLKNSHELLKEQARSGKCKHEDSQEMMNRIRAKQRNKSSNTNHDGSKNSIYNWKQNLEKGNIRSHLKKYIHFLNPLEKAANHRIEMEDTTTKTGTEDDSQ